jgi:hypothetical protein
MNDISGPYSGLVFGVSNTIATIPGIISPYIVGLLTVNVSLERNKNFLFYLDLLRYTTHSIC